MDFYNFTAARTIPVYMEANKNKAELIRMKDGDSIDKPVSSENLTAQWLYATFKGKTGYIFWSDGYLEKVAPPDDPPTDPPTEPIRDGKYWIVNLDYDQRWPADQGYKKSFHASRPTRNGVAYGAPSGKSLAATARFNFGDEIPFTKDLQEWIHGICCSFIPSSSDDYKLRSFNHMFKSNVFICNFKGVDIAANFIAKLRMKESLPVIIAMAAGGTLLKEVRTDSKYLYFEAVDCLGNYRRFNVEEHPHLFFPPAVSLRVKLSNGTFQEWYSEPFSNDYEGRARLPILSKGRDFSRIELWRVSPIRDDEAIKSPFISSNSFTYPNPYEGF